MMFKNFLSNVCAFFFFLFLFLPVTVEHSEAQSHELYYILNEIPCRTPDGTAEVSIGSISSPMAITPSINDEGDPLLLVDMRTSARLSMNQLLFDFFSACARVSQATKIGRDALKSIELTGEADCVALEQMRMIGVIGSSRDFYQFADEFYQRSWSGDIDEKGGALVSISSRAKMIERCF